MTQAEAMAQVMSDFDAKHGTATTLVNSHGDTVTMTCTKVNSEGNKTIITAKLDILIFKGDPVGTVQQICMDFLKKLGIEEDLNRTPKVRTNPDHLNLYGKF